ncbi:unnamed protein product [Lactuca saligna]|uniref:Helitron helicase-like domain-containing protein n=1 Tax=Lactuca saligna TaxID=75948 RepID=A0AA35YCT7_LACSI|nr:unnamed protein product [Lactuca saligna]
MGKRPKRKDLDFSLSPSKSDAAVNRNSRRKRVVSGGDAFVLLGYYNCGDCDCVCEFYGAFFWYVERIVNLSRLDHPRYNRCCKSGSIVLRYPHTPPTKIYDLYMNIHFLNDIGAYNSMFSMTSFGTNVDDEINNGRGKSQRISKLHPPYMSVQQPLLFPFSEDAWMVSAFKFGVADLYTIEFQKERDLPHCHTLLWVTPSKKVKTTIDSDRYITTEFLDSILEATLYQTVATCMLHGPSGLLNKDAPCMKDRNCSNFSKTISRNQCF